MSPPTCCWSSSRRSARTIEDEDAARKVARSIALYHLDRLWAEHLAELSEVREGVHLRALGRVDPLDEFHRAAVPAFNALIPEIESAHDRDVRGARRHRGLAARAGASSCGPSATWTYLVHDNPFGSEMERLIAVVGRGLRKRLDTRYLG